MIKTATIILLLFVCASSCKTIPCTNQYIVPAFIGFTGTDLDTLVIRSYMQNDNFLHIVDSNIYIRSNNPSIYLTSNDTTLVVLNYISGQEKYIMPGHDWQIYIPAKNRTISISNIISPQREYKCFGDHCGCTNNINSFVQDSILTVPGMASIPYYSYEYIVCINK